jgi:hypothetical protein
VRETMGADMSTHVRSTPWYIEAQTATYEVADVKDHKAERFKALRARGLMRFEALSIGSREHGQVAIVPLDESNRETAAFIVRACNVHDELLAALRELLAAEADASNPRYFVAIREARIAIAHATGEPA